MASHECFRCVAFGQTAVIPNLYAVIIYMHLDGSTGVQLMSDGLCKQLHYVNFCNFFAKCGLTIKNIR